MPFEATAAGVPVSIRRNPRARRLILRLSRTGEGVQVVAPRRASDRDIRLFVERNHGWIEQRLAARPEGIAFQPGAIIPIAGVPHCIQLADGLRGTIRRGDGVLVVPCLPEHLPRRVCDYLRREARTALTASVSTHASALGLPAPPVSLRDTTSRWGSCSSRGGLSFSWRLILAPAQVLDYVAAHEVAHLRHMNHGAAFWELCEHLAPQTKEAQAWLKANGATLHRYG